MNRADLIRPPSSPADLLSLKWGLWLGDAEALLDALPSKPLFDLVVTSPPYNLGKCYEKRDSLAAYLDWQRRVIGKIIPRLRPSGSLCWQVGNYVDNGQIMPLDIEFAPIFRAHGLQMRNRIIWRFGHGLHSKRRFSGRYEVVLWYTKTDDYTFNLDAVRIPAKYPGKRHFKGPRAGELSGHLLGKNPEDVWDIPNVKSNHVEKTSHPCQFLVGLIERLVRELTEPERRGCPFAEMNLSVRGAMGVMERVESSPDPLSGRLGEPLRRTPKATCQ